MAGVDGLTNSFRLMGDVMGETAAAWADWGASVIQAIAAALPQIAALTIAEEEKGGASAWAAIAGSASAYSAIPIVGPILAIAAIAAMIAAIAAVPKFAQGGLAFGPTMGLFGEYQGASSNPEVIAPLSKLRDMLDNDAGSGRVVFHISGRVLEGVLEKRSRINSRTR
jgi:hypothetical protein